MKYFLLLIVCLILVLGKNNYSQGTDNIEVTEKEKVADVAKHFLNSITDQTFISSDLISTESLDQSKDIYLKMALDYDSTGESNAMMLLPANKMKSMTSAEVWDNIHKVSLSMEKYDMHIEWNIVNTEIKNNDAFVTYEAKGREQKVMLLKKENGKWKVVLNFNPIF